MIFDVLGSQLDLDRSWLVEASAGTGKTFAIEQLFARLLIKGIPLEAILVVTFTRAATRDLQRRVAANLRHLLGLLSGEDGEKPAFLRVLNEQEAQRAQQRISRALSTFDAASIFTIHSFCARMLQERLFEADVALNAVEEQGMAARLRAVRDIFRTEVGSAMTPAEMRCLIDQHGGSLERLEGELVRRLGERLAIAKPLALSDQLSLVEQARCRLPFTTADILATFDTLAPSFRGLADRQGRVKEEIVEKVERFAALFDLEEWGEQEYEALLEDQLSFCRFFAPSLRTKRAGEVDLSLVERLWQELSPLLALPPLFARLAYLCQQLFWQRQEAEEALSYDQLLRAMEKATEHPSFLSAVQQRYRVAIIDEFQDTDPLQWKLFRTLFLSKSHLYLVGDPKQSIYAFRQADIYTYFDAADALGGGSRAVLDTNYRSHPSLAFALNRLFSSAPALFPLPKRGETLTYRPVKAGRVADGGGVRLQFGLAIVEGRRLSLERIERDYLFPFLVSELTQLGRPLSDAAVLVADRFQAARLAHFLEAYGIPAMQQRAENVAEGAALAALLELLEALIHPRDFSLVRRALGGAILGWNDEQLQQLDCDEVMEGELQRLFSWRRIWMQEGIAPLFEAVMQVCEPVLLSQRGGERLLSDLQQLAELLFEREQLGASPDQLISYLDELKQVAADEEQGLKRKIDRAADGVAILTLHASKGLEFETVFTLGLVKRSKPPSLLIPDGEQLVALKSEEDPRYLRYCEEVDAEKMRQLYVAMTRARERLFCPLLFAPNQPPLPGCASPMELFAARLGLPAVEYEALYRRLSEELSGPLCRWLDSHSEQIGYRWLQKSPPLSPLKCLPSPSLTPPPVSTVSAHLFPVHSFTSLAEEKKSALLAAPPSDFGAAEKSSHTLPAGAKTGILLHEILANIPFAAVRGGSLSPYVTPYIEKTPFAPWEEVICKLVQDALLLPLADFCLRDVADADCYREMPFLYPSGEGFTTGVIDLFFAHEGRYYLLDWKSNWLGPDQASYSPQTVEQAMEQHDYSLQAALYKEAAARYLRLVDPRPFKSCFGGVFYLFLRGSALYSMGIEE